MALVSPNGTTAGGAFFDTFLSNGSTDVLFWVQGVEGAAGFVTITASAAGFGDGTGTAEVVPAGLRISSLVSTIGATDPSDPFTVQGGLPNGSGGLSTLQSVRAGSGGILVTITNSNSLVAQLVTSSGGAQSRGVLIAENQPSSPSSVPSGGIEFDPLESGEGDTTVEATSPGIQTTTAGIVTVTVIP